MNFTDRIATLNAQGHGDRHIARELQVTRHHVRKTLLEIAQANANLPALPIKPGTVLELYDAACRALGEAAVVEDVLPLLDQIEHVKLHARKVRDRELLADAAAFQQKAERRLGQIILAAREAGHFLQGNRVAKSSDQELLTRATLAEVGVDKKLSARAQKLAALDNKAFEADNTALRERIGAGSAKVIEEPLLAGSRAIAPGRSEPTESLDYFPTPPWATRALVEHVLPRLAGTTKYRLRSAWEPACGEGHIAEVLREYCPDVLASDVFDYGYGDQTIDFLEYRSPQTGEVANSYDWIITNPPFGEKAAAFVLRGMEWARVGVAMFFRTQWAVEGVDRYDRIFRDWPPTLFCPFVERVNLCKGRWDPEGTTATSYCWLVWHHVKGVGWAGTESVFRIPPGCREKLTRPDDVDRFTAKPVVKKIHQHAAGLMAPTASEPACATLPPSQLPAHAGSLDIPENLRRRAAVMTTIKIGLAEQAHLASLYRVAFSWMGAAAGFSSAYKHPVARLLARDQARARLDEYFAAIEELVPR